MHQAYTVEDLLLDDSFIKYCREPYSSESRKWQQLIADNNISEEMINEAKSILAMLSPELGHQEITEEIKKLRMTIAKNDVAEIGFTMPVEEYFLRRKKRLVTLKRAIMGIAAVVLLTVGWIALRPGKKVQESVLASFTTGTGELKKFQLPDGSSVILNSNSNLSYNTSFNLKERVVKLSGKAFFQVAKNRSKPFSVHSNQFNTTALGTSFYVNGDSVGNYSVKLVEGKVKVKSAGEHEAILAPGEEAAWVPGVDNFEVTNYDTHFMNTWLAGEILFNKTTLHDALQLLQQWYGVEILDNRSEKRNMMINGKYENARLDDILKVICFTLDCKVKHENNRIIIE